MVSASADGSDGAPHTQTIYTVGHSTRAQEGFLAILRAFSIRRVVDIRTIPGSRKNPQFNQTEMSHWLREGEIEYTHCGELGGLRHPLRDSVNSGWRNNSFRGYADYMQSSHFGEAVERLISSAGQVKTVIMCAEAVPWRCHRSLVGDALLVRGIDVQNIMSASSSRAHVLTPWARVDGLRITYPPTVTTDEA